MMVQIHYLAILSVVVTLPSLFSWKETVLPLLAWRSTVKWFERACYSIIQQDVQSLRGAVAWSELHLFTFPVQSKSPSMKNIFTQTFVK
jgi:hypothetical protein